MGNQGCIYLVMFGSRSWLNFGTNSHLCFVSDCVCKVHWRALKLFICFSQNMPAIPAAWHRSSFCLSLVIVLSLWSASIFFPIAAKSHHRLAGVCDRAKLKASLLKTNTLKNYPKFGLCCLLFPCTVTIWVHMAAPVQRTICYQAVIFIWIWVVQIRPYVAEFHHGSKICRHCSGIKDINAAIQKFNV